MLSVADKRKVGCNDDDSDNEPSDNGKPRCLGACLLRNALGGR